MFGLQLGRLGIAGSSRWSPTSLFSAGEAGGLWDFSSLANLYQDSAGTTPCTAAGDPIGKVLDTSGRGNHLTQATSTKRPTVGYDAGTGKYYAIFDGVDDCLVSSSTDFTSTNKITAFAGLNRLGTAGAEMIYELSSDAITGGLNGVNYYTAASSAYLGAGSNIVNGSYSAAAPFASVSTNAYDRTLTGLAQLSARSNGVAKTLSQENINNNSGNFGSYPIYVGQRAAASLPYNGHISVLCFRGSATDADTIAAMEKWIAARTPGVTLP